jgi:hypothetical protein
LPALLAVAFAAVRFVGLFPVVPLFFHVHFRIMTAADLKIKRVLPQLQSVMPRLFMNLKIWV